MPHLVPRLLFAALIAAGAAIPCGCSHISVFSRNKIERADTQNPATEIISLWQPAKGPGLNGVPGRGLAGQVLFFTRGSGAPVAVEGDVRVYLFDNQGTVEQQAKPIWQFDFPAADWQNFGSVGTLGPAYNIFIPYVREGQQQVECAVQLRFTPKAGPVVFSEMTQVTLPGKIDATEGGFLPEKGPPTLAPQQLPGNAAQTSEPRQLSPEQRGVAVHTIRPRATGGIEQVSHTAMASEPSAAADAISRAQDAASRTASAGAAPADAIVHADYVEAQDRARDERLEELERYVRQLEAERARAPLPLQPEPDAPSADEPEPSTPQAAPRLRLRLTPAATSRAVAPEIGSPFDGLTSAWDSAQ